MDETELVAEQAPVSEKKAAMANEDEKQLELISKKYNVPKVCMLKVPLNDTYTSFAIGYIRYPSRVDVSIAMTMQDTDPLKGKEIVLRNSWLEGDTRILEDDETFMSACTVLDHVLAIRQAIIKKNWMSGR